jgi:hypothetical protein
VVGAGQRASLNAGGFLRCSHSSLWPASEDDRDRIVAPGPSRTASLCPRATTPASRSVVFGGESNQLSLNPARRRGDLAGSSESLSDGDDAKVVALYRGPF